jgi:phosphatidylethanolamine-binding protein (PEBP) family uncharacterized protein
MGIYRKLALWLVALALQACSGSADGPPAARMAATARAASVATVPDATALMNWAEAAYPSLFPGPQPDNTSVAPYTYRYYPQTGNYLGVAGSDVYVLGPVASLVAPASGGGLYKVGVLADFACNVYPASCSSSFTVSSTAALAGGSLPATFTCDGAGVTMPLAWSNAPAGTAGFAVQMTTLPGDGSTHWSWVLYDVPATATGLAMASSGVGTLGLPDGAPSPAYSAPCSQGPGNKTYTFTVTALSAQPTFSVPASQVTGQVLATAIAPLTLASASLDVGYARATSVPSTTAAIHCAQLQASTAAYAASVSVDCSATDYGTIASLGMPQDHGMMDGITATNLQVPVAQNFTGSNGWRIPLAPALAATTTDVADGPVGIAINGVPLFNPCKQGGCQNGDTKVLGELDICNGHAGRADDYHYHAAPTCLMATQPASYWNTHPIGWALDGFAIFGYNNADGTTATRDGVCGGNTAAVSNAPAGYSYHVTDSSPYIMSCLRGTPSPDLTGQGAKYTPMRQPPVTPFAVSGMTLTTDASDGYQVLRFTSASAFTTTETGSDSYVNPAGTYRIRYKEVTGSALATLLAQNQNIGKTQCWSFQFTTDAGQTSQPAVSYCR